MAAKEEKKFDMFDKLEDYDEDNEPIITDDGQVTVEMYYSSIESDGVSSQSNIILKFAITLRSNFNREVFWISNTVVYL